MKERESEKEKKKEPDVRFESEHKGTGAAFIHILYSSDMSQ